MKWEGPEAYLGREEPTWAEGGFWDLLEGKGCCAKRHPDTCIGASGGALASFISFTDELGDPGEMALLCVAEP